MRLLYQIIDWKCCAYQLLCPLAKSKGIMEMKYERHLNYGLPGFFIVIVEC
jgi:hypothetical protein